MQKDANTTPPENFVGRTSAAALIQRTWRKRAQRVRFARSQTTLCNQRGEKCLLSNRLVEAIELAKILSTGTQSGGSKAQLMSAHHFIEAADPKHRYGSKLGPYYKVWLDSGSHDNFFRWLDRGDGKGLDLSAEGHPRHKLQSSMVTYLKETERARYLVDIRNGVFYWMASGELVDTSPKRTCALDLRFRLLGLPMKYIFVIDLHDRLFVAKKKKGCFHHSSFLGARPVRLAGSIIVKAGRLCAVNASSGHYRPDDTNFDRTLHMLEDKYGVQGGTYVKVYPPKGKCCFGKLMMPAAMEGILCCRRRARLQVQPV